MTATTEKLGLFLPQGLHEQMVRAAAERLGGRKTPRGGVRLVYEQAFNDLLAHMDKHGVLQEDAQEDVEDKEAADARQGGDPHEEPPQS